MPEPDQTTLLTDDQGVVRMASTAAADLFGSSTRDLEGLRLDELLESPPRPVLEALFRALADRGHAPCPELPTRLAARLRLPEGRLLEADLHVSRLPAGTAARGANLISIESIQTPRRAAPATDAESLPPLTETVAAGASASEDAWLVCRGDLIEQVGEGLAGLVGVEPATLAGWKVQSLISAEDLLPAMEILRGVESGASTSREFGFRLMRAKERPPVEVAARARRVSRSGRPAVLLGLRDISQALHAARATAERLMHLDAALSATSDAVLILGLPEDGSPLILASRSTQDLLSTDPSHWIGRPFGEFWRETLRTSEALPVEADGELERLLEDPREVRVDTVVLSRPQSRVIERYVGPMKSADGSVIGRICTLRDVTQRAQAEAEVRRAAEEARVARAELELLHEELRLANEGLEKRMTEMHRLNKDLRILDEMKSNLLANVSHELQTPLVSIKGFTEMILKGRLGGVTPEQERGLQVALRNVNRLIGLIDNLLAFARSQGPTTTLKLQAFPLGPLVQEAVELVREKAEGRGVDINVVMPPSDLLVRADRDKILQVFLNLLTNAIKYNRDGGGVTVEAESGRRGVARIEVRDTGIGIPRDELDRIFDRYYQAANAEGVREGTGIGLSITKNILRLHGCMIRADSEQGKGSVFSFTLPLDRKSRGERVPRFSGAAGPAGLAAGETEPSGEPLAAKDASRSDGQEPM